MAAGKHLSQLLGVVLEELEEEALHVLRRALLGVCSSHVLIMSLYCVPFFSAKV